MTTPNEFRPVKMPPPSPQPPPPFYQHIDFWLGFIAWYVVSGLTLAIFAPRYLINGEGPAFVLFLSFCGGNVLVLIIANFVRRRFAEGMVAAVAVGFVIYFIWGSWRPFAMSFFSR